MTNAATFRPPLSLPVVAYDLSRWQGFLLPVVVPSAARMPVIPGESKNGILARTPEDFKGTFAFHINLTNSSCCPADRAALVADLLDRGIRTLNSHVVDISKRFVQDASRRAGLETTTASQRGDPSELLIVKTNRNYGGKPEARLSNDIRKAFTLAEQITSSQHDHGYLVFPRRDVPAATWEDPNLVVERYIENASNLFYRAYFVCNRFAVSEGREQALVKTIGRADRQRLLLFSINADGTIDSAIPSDLQPAVDAILRFVNVTCMDFGCLDILRDDNDRFYIVDMNATAHWGAETELRIIEHIASGVCGGNELKGQS
jgi:hypothetical protein